MRAPGATFQFLEVSGWIKPLDQQWLAPYCSMVPPTGDVDLDHHRITVPARVLQRWRAANSTLIVLDEAYGDADGSSCNVPSLGPLGPDSTLRFHTGAATMGMDLFVLSNQDGPTVGYRVLEQGVPYHHRAYWAEQEPTTGEVHWYEVDVEFLYRGDWAWSDVQVGEGNSVWAG